MKYVLALVTLFLCTLPSVLPATNLGNLILSLPGAQSAQQLPSRLVPMPDDLFTEATGFRYEAIPGIPLRTPGKPEDGLLYWIPRDWVDAITKRLNRENALEIGQKTGEALRIYSSLRYAGLATDLNEIVQQTLTVSLAYRASGYDTRLLGSLYISWQAAFLQTLPAFQALRATHNGKTEPSVIDVMLSQLNDPKQIASAQPGLRLAALNSALYTGLLQISRAILAERPASITAWNCIAMLARSRNAQALLLESLRALERLSPKNAEHSITLAEALYETGNHECTNVASRALKKDSRFSHRAQAILRGMKLRTMVDTPSNLTTPEKWGHLADALANEGMLEELDKLLSTASPSMKRSPSWLIHNLNRKSGEVLSGLSRHVLAVVMQPSGIPGILATQRDGIQDWFISARLAATLYPTNKDVFTHLVLSGLLASTLDGLNNSMTAWEQLKTALPANFDHKSLEAGISRLALKRFPELLSLLRSSSTATLFEASADHTQRLQALRDLVEFLRNLAHDLDGLSLPTHYPHKGAAHLAGRLIALAKTLLSQPLPEQAILDVLAGNQNFSPFGNSLPEGLRLLNSGLTRLFAPTPSATANKELITVLHSMETILGLIAGFTTLPESARKDIFTAELPAKLEDHIRTLLTHNLHSPSARPWLKAAVLISRARITGDRVTLTRAVHFLIEALDRLDQPSLLQNDTILHLYTDTRQLQAVILQNLGYCLAELRHKDAAAFTGSTLRKTTTPLERVMAMIDHIRVIREYRQTALVPELRQLATAIANQSNLSTDDARDMTWVALTWLLPYAGNDAPSIREQIRLLGITNPLRLSTFSFGSSYGAYTGFMLYAQVTLQAFSTPETWLRP